MPDKNACEIIVLLDRSGSMQSVKSDMEGGFNQYVKDQQELPGACAMTLVEFDTSGIDTVYEARPIAEVPPLELTPRGGTPLLDAMGTTIKRTGERLRRTPEARRPGRVLFVVLTDGEENSSHRYTKPAIKSMVEHQTQKYGWQFVFLGANLDAFTEAQSLGILRSATANFTANAGGVGATFQAMSCNTQMYRSGNAYQMTDDQRKQMDETSAPVTPP